MAAFPPITIADNPDGWGPTSLPESLLNFPYHIDSKGERLGKVSIISYIIHYQFFSIVTTPATTY